jgi:anion-transporting  ArsA/GET3 family ATPase
MADLFDLDFVFVVGKGGTGKTTTSAAVALAAARRGKRVLVAMANAKERLSHLLEVEPIGTHNQRILPDIDAVNMTPRVALEEYGMMILKVRTLYKAIFENKLVSAFLRGTPGIEAWSMLGKAFFHTKETDETGRRRYDLVIFDAPATGHGLEMLRVPQVIVDVAPPGLLRREAADALALFRDPKRAGVLVATLPEDMPTNETIELHEALTKELRMPVSRIVVNGVVPVLFRDGERAAYEGLSGRLPHGSPLASLARAARVRSLRERTQQESILRLSQEIAVPRVELPLLFVPEFRRSAVESLSHAFG